MWGAIGPCVAISHRALHETMREGIAVRLGATVTSLDDDEPDPPATFADGSDFIAHDLAVQADGVHSRVRSAAFRGADARFVCASWCFPRPTAWRSLDWTVLLAGERHSLRFRLEAAWIYRYADVNARLVDPIDGDPSDKLVDFYSDFAQPVARILEEPDAH